MSQESFKVPTTRLGKSGLRVSKIILGGMSYGNKKWNNNSWVVEGDEALEHMKAAYDMGIYTWDTANVYSNGESEKLFGRALKKYNIPRQKVVLFTKLYFHSFDDDPSRFALPDNSDTYTGLENQQGLNRVNIIQSVQDSLRRLDTDYIDVLFCHRFDYNTPIEETMQALHEVVQRGWVRYLGMSSCFAYQFHAMQNYAINNKLTPFIVMQDMYNAVYREEEHEMFRVLDMFGVGCVPWSPLALGFLARPVSQQHDTTRGQTDMAYQAFRNVLPFQQESQDKVNKAIEEVAKKRNVSMAQVALAFVLANKTVSAPIVGSTKISSIADLAHATQLELTQEELDAIKEPYVQRPPFTFE